MYGSETVVSSFFVSVFAHSLFCLFCLYLLVSMNLSKEKETLNYIRTESAGISHHAAAKTSGNEKLKVKLST